MNHIVFSFDDIAMHFITFVEDDVADFVIILMTSLLINITSIILCLILSSLPLLIFLFFFIKVFCAQIHAVDCDFDTKTVKFESWCLYFFWVNWCNDATAAFVFAFHYADLVTLIEISDAMLFLHTQIIIKSFQINRFNSCNLLVIFNAQNFTNSPLQITRLQIYFISNINFHLCIFFQNWPHTCLIVGGIILSSVEFPIDIKKLLSFISGWIDVSSV